MTIQTWLDQQRKLLEAATKGPWYVTGEFDYRGVSQGEHISPCDGAGETWEDEDWRTKKDNEFIASVRTEHERALKIIEKIDSLYEAIKHGDESHKAWLKDAIEKHFTYFPDDCEVGE